jgi:hypothetical protein
MGYYGFPAHSVSRSHRVYMVDQEQFMFAECANMLLLLGECHGNAIEAFWRYRERYPQYCIAMQYVVHK